jgi:hypothetical protein
MQLLLLAAAPSLAQVASLAICGCIVGKVHYQMVVERDHISVRNFASVVVTCASIQVVFRVLDNTNLNWVIKMMPVVMCH